MLRDLLSSRAILGGLVFCVVIVGCTQFYSWQVRRTSQKELERTTRTVQQLKKQNETRAAEVEKSPPPGETAQSGHWHGDEWHANETHRQEHLPSTTHLETPEPEFLSGESPPADASITQMKALKEKIDGINARIQAKYPEFAELTTLTPEEIAARYPTEADMLALLKRVDDFLVEFLQDIRTVFADAPIELREAAYDIVYKQLEQSWGTEAANESMKVLRGMVE